MAATERPRLRARHAVIAVVLVALVALVALVGVIVPFGGGGGEPVPPLPALPRTGRSDVRLAVDVARRDGALHLSFTVGVEREAEAPLWLTVWSGAGPDPWSSDGGGRTLLGAHGERLPGGQVVVHLGLATPPTPEDVDRVEPPSSDPLQVAPGRELLGRAALDPDQRSVQDDPVVGLSDVADAEEVRVCVWAGPADRSVRQATGRVRPVVCADDRL